MTTPDTTGGVSRIIAQRYRLGPRRGSGIDMARFDAFDTQLQRIVTLRMVHPDLTALETLRTQFRPTMDATAAVHHPNIAPVLDWGVDLWNDREMFFVVYEQLAGGSLRELLDRGRRLTPSQALVVGLDACKGLDAMHRAGLLHGDVRPATLVFGEDRRLRLVDAGLGSLLSGVLWGDPGSIGNERALYASPEQAVGQPAGATSDVYSLCLSLLESMSGVVPFAGDSPVATLANRVGKLMPVSADLGSLAAVLERAGRPDPADRSTAAQFGRGLVEAAGKQPRPAPIPVLTPSPLDRPIPAAPGAPVEPTGPLRRPAITEDADGAAAASGGAIPVPPVPQPVPPVPQPEPVPVPPVPQPGPVPAPPPEPGPPVPQPEPVPAPPPEPGPLPTPAPPQPVPEPAVPALAGPGAADRAGAPPTVALPIPAEAITPKPAKPYDDLGEAPTASMAATSRPAHSPAPTKVMPVPPSTSGPARRRRRRWPWVLLAVLLLAAGGAVGALKVLAAGKKSVDIHPVPDLHGRTQQDAAALITADEWNTTVSQEYDDDVPVGTIIRTDPAPLFPLRPAGTLGLVVSQGPKPRLLPELAGKTLEDATATLAALKLTISQAAPAYDENVPAGAVVSWSVPSQPTLIAGGQVLPGTDVQVVLSQGPAPRTVPNLIGQTLEQAHAALDPVGLVIAEAPQEFNNDVLSGGIVRTDPVAGGQLPKGGTVTIVVSKGRDLVTFPSFPATDLATVQQVLADSGFVVASVTGNSAGSLYQAMVNGKAVQAGQTFDRGTAVDLIFL